MPHSRVGLKVISQVYAPIRSPLSLAVLVLTSFNLTVIELSQHTDTYVSLLGLNLLLCMIYLILQPAKMGDAATTAHDTMQETIDHVHQMIQQIIHAYFEQHQMEYQLSQAHTSLERFHAEQTQFMSVTKSEVTQQYQNILAYAHYLEQCITTRHSDSSLRDDYDAVCEQAFNLQLIVQAMGMLPAHVPAPVLGNMALADRMASILLDLAPSLDRRAMRLTTTAWDENAYVISNSEWLTHTLWMMLLGCIRFAEDESTLTLSCAKEDARIKVDVTVSFLSAGALTETERYAYLQKRMMDGQEEAHMFASTLDAHANIQLGKMLAERLGARLIITPLHTHACTLTLLLPCAQ
jgi:hypothetical protein